MKIWMKTEIVPDVARHKPICEAYFRYEIDEVRRAIDNVRDLLTENASPPELIGE